MSRSPKARAGRRPLGRAGRIRRIIRPFTTMVLVFGLIAGAELSGAIATEFLAAQEAELTNLLNQERTSRGLTHLPTSDALRTIARRHAQRMMMEDRIFHSTTLRDEVQAVFPEWASIGENVGVGPDIPITHQAFMDSEGHRANILDTRWQTMGIGVIAGDRRLFMTENFLKLRDGEAVPPDASGDTSSSAERTTTEVASNVTRLSGAGRVATGEAIVKFAFPAGSAGGAVLADAFDFHGALVGAALAGSIDGPIVLSSTGQLDNDAADALTHALGANSGKTVHVIGNFGGNVVASLRALGYQVTQYTGATHEAVAVAVARALPGNPRQAFVARSDNYPDALAASAVSAHTGWPIMFTPTNTLDGFTAGALEELGISTVHIVGGVNAVSASVASAIDRLVQTVQRTAGSSRIDTGLAIAELGLANGMSVDTVLIATAFSFPDALAGGGAAGHLGAPVVLTDSGSLSGAVATWLADHRDSISRVALLGGTSALSAAVQSGVGAALR